MFNETISQELLVIGAKTKLVELIKNYVHSMRALWPDYPLNVGKFDYGKTSWSELSKEFSEAVKKIVGVNVSIDVYGGTEDFNMGVFSSIWFYGHTGARWYDIPELKVISNDKVDLKDTITIDLEKVHVKGSLPDELTFRLYYTEAIMFNHKMFTEEEVVGVMLHEFGHIFNTFVTLGDYVWLNYYLTDGIEILTGKKKNVYKLEVFNDSALKKIIPADEYEKFVNERNETNAKRAVLSLAKLGPRHHLTDNKISANRREEQLADLFATRLGYGRALAQFNYKYDKYYGSPEVIGANWFAETAKIMITIGLLPFAVLGIMLYDPVTHGLTGRYDDPFTRIVRIRRDLVAQLKQSSPIVRDALVVDIDAVDKILEEYTKQRSVFDVIIDFFRPSIRKMRQNDSVEDSLETLLNNDLFTQAHKLSKL